MVSTKDIVQKAREKNTKQHISTKKNWASFNTLRVIEDTPNQCDNEFNRKSPLLQTEWSQGCGFNDYMPSMGGCNVPCGKAYAGCVPIAIAQVMKYHNYPSSYNWSDMPNKYGTNSTSLLIKDIHIAINDINYNCDGTGVDKDYNIAGVFRNNFGYSSASQASYNVSSVTSSIANNKPVILGGGRNKGWSFINIYSEGHMWVCDGFLRNKICNFAEDGTLLGSQTSLLLHMNWGWGNGYENGWYAFNNFNPGSNSFNFKVKMIANITP